MFVEVNERQRYVQREVRDRKTRWHSLRMRPYKTGDNKSGGVMIVLLNIDEAKRTLEKIRESRDYARTIIETIREPLLVLNARLQVITANRSFCEMFKVQAADVEGQPFFKLSNHQWNVPRLRELIEDILPKHSRIEDFELDHEFPVVGHRRLMLNARQTVLDGAGTEMILIAIEDITERRRKEEATIRALFESAAQAIITVRPDGRIALVNAMTEKMFGYRRDELLGKPVDILFPPSVRKRHANHFKGYFATPRSRPMGVGLDPEGRRKDGTQFPVEIGLSHIETGEGRLAVAFVTDITDRRGLEKAVEADRQQIRALLSRLLTAQEEERRRVSRDLHDDLCQQLAALAFDVDRVAADLPASAAAQSRLRTLQSQMIKVSKRAQNISHQLHPSVLDDLGLAVSLEALCKEFSQRGNMAVKFTHGKLPSALPGEVASCLYRVSQECLHNAGRHSRAKHVALALRATRSTLVLSIEDDGVGFDPEAVKGKGGLGMVSMGERARLVSGVLSIESAPGNGARVVLKVPLGSNGL
jgi:PAS domain S-box-containing protein